MLPVVSPLDPFNLLASLLGIFLIQVFFFAFAATFKTDKLTDLAYGLTFVFVALLHLFFSMDWGFRIACIAVIAWGLRLAIYLFVRILHMGHDARFDGRREDLVRFAFFWFFQAIVIWIVSLPLIFASSQSDFEMNWLSFIGLALFLIGFGIESIADQQKFTFKKNPAHRDLWIQTGLWKYARFPNYTGEIILWWGIWLLLSPAFSGIAWCSVLGPMCITFILLRVSGIPLLEESQERRFGNIPEWREYVRRTNRLFLWPPA